MSKRQLQQKTKKRKVAVLTGGRIEFGYTRPVIREIQRRGTMDYEIIAANMHLLPEFGNTIDEILRDGFTVGAAVHNTLAGYNRLTMVKSLGVFMTELPGIIDRMKPDIILLAGDRGEQFVGAMVGAHMHIPVAHIHFAANKDAADRLKKMGEERFRIFNIGAPQLDELVAGNETPEKDVRKKFGLRKGTPAILLVQHSVTEEAADAERQMTETLKAVSSFPHPIVLIMNNSDAGSPAIRQAIHAHANDRMKVYEHVSREDYAGLMRTCNVLVGNSSAGIIEAPVFKIPVVNIGNRQKGRFQSTNVINVGYNARAIQGAIAHALAPAFANAARRAPSVYGDGHSAKRIVDILQNIPINQKLLVKNLTY